MDVQISEEGWVALQKVNCQKTPGNLLHNGVDVIAQTDFRVLVRGINQRNVITKPQAYVNFVIHKTAIQWLAVTYVNGRCL